MQTLIVNSLIWLAALALLILLLKAVSWLLLPLAAVALAYYRPLATEEQIVTTRRKLENSSGEPRL